MAPPPSTPIGAGRPSLVEDSTPAGPTRLTPTPSSGGMAAPPSTVDSTPLLVTAGATTSSASGRPPMHWQVKPINVRAMEAPTATSPGSPRAEERHSRQRPAGLGEAEEEGKKSTMELPPAKALPVTPTLDDDLDDLGPTPPRKQSLEDGRTSSSASSSAGARCCAYIHATMASFAKSCFSFVGILATSSVLSISIACIVIIVLWYTKTRSTVDQLSEENQDKVFTVVLANIERELQQPLQVLEAFDLWVSTRFDTFENITDISTEAGFLAGIAALRQAFPAVTTIGCATESGLTFTGQNQNKSIAQAKPNLGNLYLFTVPTISPATFDASGHILGSSSLSYFQLQTPNPSFPGTLVPDFVASDTPESMRALLGRPIFNATNFIARNTGSFKRSQVVSAAGLGSGWVLPVISSTTLDLAVQALKPSRARHPVDMPGVDGAKKGTPYYVTFATILVSRLEAILKSFPLGDRGYALVFSSQGLLIGTTLAISPQQRQATNVFSRNESISSSLAVPFGELIHRGFTTYNASSLVLGNDIVPRAPFQTRVHTNGLTYNVRVSQLTVPGLDWILLVYTVGSDFNGGLDSALWNTSWASAAVLVLALFFTILISRLLTRPLLRVSALLNDAVVAIGMEKGRRQRRALRKVIAEFEHDTGQRVQAGQELIAGEAEDATAAGPTAEPDEGVSGASVTAAEKSSVGMVDVASLHGSPAADGTPITATRTTMTSAASSTLVTASSASVTAAHFDSLQSPSILTPGTVHQAQQQQQPAPAPASIALEMDTRTQPLASSAATLKPRAAHVPPQPISWWRRVFCCGRGARPSSSSHPSSGALSSSQQQQPPPQLHRGNFSANLLEVSLMHRSIGSLLHALSANDQLELVNQAKRAFIRYVFHEVRVPFNAIALGTDQLLHHANTLHGTVGAEVRELAQLISEQAKVVARILNDVLSMQKIEDGGLQLQAESFDLLAMIRVTLGTFKELMAAKQLTLVMHLQPLEQQLWAVRALKEEKGKILVYGDKYRLRQVLSNFVSNAISYSPPFGTITVRVSDADFRPAKASGAPRSGSPSLTGVSLRDFTKNGGQTTTTHQAHHRHPSKGGPLVPPSAPMSPHHVHKSASVASAGPGGIGTVEPSLSGQEISSSSGSGPTLLPGGIMEPPSPNAASAAAAQHILGRVTFRVSVSDCGPGIPVAYRSAIFSAYKQVQSARIQQGRGTGLGLQISRSIIELHRGKIGFNTSEGRGGGSKSGSEFFFVLPLPVVFIREEERGLLGVDEEGAFGHTPVEGSSGGGAPTHQYPSVYQAASARGRQLSPIEASLPSPGGSSGGDQTGVLHQQHQPQQLHPPSSLHRRPSNSELPSVNFHADEFDVALAVYSDMHSRTRDDEPEQVAEGRARLMRSVPVTPTIDEEGGADTTPVSPAYHVYPMMGASPVNVVTSAIPTSSSSSPPGGVVGASASSRPPRRPKASPPAEGPRPRILVVEDSAPNRKLLMSLLRILKCDVFGADNGQVACDLFADVLERPNECKSPFDLVLMDGSMPVLSGPEATTFLRSKGVTTPIIAVTGNALAEDVTMFRAAGAQHVLLKPINREELTAALRAYLPQELTKHLPPP